MFFRINKLAGMKPYSAFLIVLFLLSSNLITLFSSRLLGTLTDTAQNESLSDVLNLMPFLAVILLSQIIVETLRTFYFEWKQQQAYNKLSDNALNQILNARIQSLSEQDKADIYIQATNNLRQSISYVFGSSLDLLSTLINFCVCSIYLILLNWYLFLAFILMWVAILIIQYLMSRIPGNMIDKTIALETEVYDSFRKNYKFLNVIRAYGLEEKQEYELTTNMNQYFDAAKKTWKHRSILIVPMTLLTYCPTFIMFILLLYMSSHQTITIGDITATVTLLISANSHLENLPTLLINWRTDKAGVNRYMRLMNLEAEPYASLPAGGVDDKATSIRLSHVSLTYEDAQVLSDISLSIQRGEHVAIVGQSGSGKSSLLRLMMGIQAPTQGIVRTSGNDPFIDSNVKKSMSVVLQNSMLFEGSIRQNIAYGDPSASDEQIDLVMRAACVDFDNEGSTLVDTLSGGQKRRVELARSYLKAAQLYFFDESLSEIDGENQKQILQNQDDILKGKTCIKVTHCLEEALHAQRVIVIDHGRIVEEGKPDELLNRHSMFSRIFSGSEETNNA